MAGASELTNAQKRLVAAEKRLQKAGSAEEMWGNREVALRIDREDLEAEVEDLEDKAGALYVNPLWSPDAPGNIKDVAAYKRLHAEIDATQRKLDAADTAWEQADKQHKAALKEYRSAEADLKAAKADVQRLTNKGYAQTYKNSVTEATPAQMREELEDLIAQVKHDEEEMADSINELPNFKKKYAELEKKYREVERKLDALRAGKPYDAKETPQESALFDEMGKLKRAKDFENQSIEIYKDDIKMRTQSIKVDKAKIAKLTAQLATMGHATIGKNTNTSRVYKNSVSESTMYRLHYRKPGASRWFHTPTLHASEASALRESDSYCDMGFTEVRVLEVRTLQQETADLRDAIKDIAMYKEKIREAESKMAALSHKWRTLGGKPDSAALMDAHLREQKVVDKMAKDAIDKWNDAKKRKEQAERNIATFNTRSNVRMFQGPQRNSVSEDESFGLYEADDDRSPEWLQARIEDAEDRVPKFQKTVEKTALELRQAEATLKSHQVGGSFKNPADASWHIDHGKKVVVGLKQRLADAQKDLAKEQAELKKWKAMLAKQPYKTPDYNKKGAPVGKKGIGKFDPTRKRMDGTSHPLVSKDTKPKDSRQILFGTDKHYTVYTNSVDDERT